MATVVWGGTVARQPAQGEMRRFIVKERIDGRVTPALAADANKAMLIKAGWLVKGAFVRLLTVGTTYGIAGLIDSDGVTLGSTFASGGSVATAGLGGTSMAVLAGVSSIGGSGGKFYASDAYISATFTATFDGLMDVFADVIDTNARENPSAWTD